VKIGIGSYAFRWAIGARHAQPMTPEGMLDQAAALGAEVVQICDNVPLAEMPDGALEALAARAERLGLELEVGIRGSRPRQLARGLEVAERLGARLLRVVLADGAWHPGFDEAAALLGDLLPELRAAGVTLAIENHFHMPPTALAELVRAMDDPRIGVCLDPLNSIALLVGVAETVAALAPLAASLHVKDATVTRQGAGWAIQGCRLGEGQADIAGVLAAVYKADAGCPVRRSPNVVVEGWMDALDDEAATLAQEEDWVRQGIAYLKEWRAR
jgi:sugar phosphate isomerase/epimerase